MTLKDALATVLDMADAQQAADKEQNSIAKSMGFTDNFNTKAQAQAIKVVNKLFKSL